MFDEEYEIGAKIVFVDSETYPQIWTIEEKLSPKVYRVGCDGPYLAIAMPAAINEIRLASAEEQEANKRL